MDELTTKTSITFTLVNWCGDGDPSPGQVVVLQNVQLYERGWRAASARPITLSS